jgi:hypothetical protein
MVRISIVVFLLLRPVYFGSPQRLYLSVREKGSGKLHKASFADKRGRPRDAQSWLSGTGSVK